MNSGFHPGGVNQRVYRYADVLLMLAECEAEVGTPAQAAIYINQVRSRAGVTMPAVTLTTKNAALLAVMHERAVELGAEEVASIDVLRWRKKGYFLPLRRIRCLDRLVYSQYLPVKLLQILWYNRLIQYFLNRGYSIASIFLSNL